MFEFVKTQTLGIISPPGSLYCYFFAVLSLFKVGLRVEVVVEIGRMNTVIIYLFVYTGYWSQRLKKRDSLAHFTRLRMVPNCNRVRQSDCNVRNPQCPAWKKNELRYLQLFQTKINIRNITHPTTTFT